MLGQLLGRSCPRVGVEMLFSDRPGQLGQPLNFVALAVWSPPLTWPVSMLPMSFGLLQFCASVLTMAFVSGGALMPGSEWLRFMAFPFGLPWRNMGGLVTLPISSLAKTFFHAREWRYVEAVDNLFAHQNEKSIVSELEGPWSLLFYCLEKKHKRSRTKVPPL